MLCGQCQWAPFQHARIRLHTPSKSNREECPLLQSTSVPCYKAHLVLRYAGLRCRHGVIALHKMRKRASDEVRSPRFPQLLRVDQFTSFKAHACTAGFVLRLQSDLTSSTTLPAQLMEHVSALHRPCWNVSGAASTRKPLKLKSKRYHHARQH